MNSQPSQHIIGQHPCVSPRLMNVLALLAAVGAAAMLATPAVFAHDVAIASPTTPGAGLNVSPQQAKAGGALVLNQLAARSVVAPAASMTFRQTSVALELWHDSAAPAMLGIKWAKSLSTDQKTALFAHVGLSVKSEHAIGEPWTLIVLDSALSVDAAKAAVAAFALSADVALASPVFHAPLDASCWWLPTEGIMAQANAGDSAAAAAKHGLSVAGMLAEATMASANLATLLMLTSELKNGFDILDQANAAASDGAFAFAEPDARQRFKADLIPNDPLFGQQWQLRNILRPEFDVGADEAWDFVTGSPLVRVAVLDDGVDITHNDLNLAAGLSRDFTTGATAGAGNGSHQNDCERHGTAVSGMIAAIIDNAFGVVGVAPSSPVIICKIATIAPPPDCSGAFAAFQWSWVVNALSYARSSSARSTNMNFRAGGSSQAFESTIAATRQAGVAHFAASGNGGNASISYPSSAPLVNAVGSMDRNVNRSIFSQYGTGLDFTAPGEQVVTTDRMGAVGYSEGGAAVVDGTSFASPLAAGVAALFFSSNPTSSALDCETAMQSGAFDLGLPSYDQVFGYGLINGYGTLNFGAPGLSDTCATAEIIPAGPSLPNTPTAFSPVPYSTRFATNDTGCLPTDPCGLGLGKTVWYRFTAPSEGTMVVSSAVSNYDTVVSVLSAAPGANHCGNVNNTAGCVGPAFASCNDDAIQALRYSQVTVRVTATATYFIKVAGYNSASGLLFFGQTLTPDAAAPITCSLADIASGSLDTTRNPNNSVGPEDLDAFITGLLADNADIADVDSDSLDTTFNPNGVVGPKDLDAFISSFLVGC